MTKQEAYEAIRAFFTQPGAMLAKTPEGTCLYRVVPELGLQPGNACAFGCLIPDNLYDEAIEHTSISGWIDNEFEEGSDAHTASRSILTFLGLAPVDNSIHDDSLFNFLKDAQHRHDNNSTDARSFVLHLDKLAADNGLTVPA